MKQGRGNGHSMEQKRNRWKDAMKRVNLKQRVLDAFYPSNSVNRSGGGSNSSAPGGSSSSGGKNDLDVPESLAPDCFQLCKVMRHGFPHRPTSIAYDPVQKLVAIGNMAGSIRILGQPGVDDHVTHDTESAVIQLLFLINEGGLISVCADNSVNMWNIRQKNKGILHSVKFNKERITFCHLPYKSKWLYIGTDRGNVHLCSIETFTLSGYTINWNKAIELSQKSHPGIIVGIQENPCDENKLLIAFETGLILLWDLKMKAAESRYYSDSYVRQVTWHHEGKQFMCCHGNGSLSSWNYRNSSKPQHVHFPHAKSTDSSKFDSFRPIEKLEWKTCRNSEPFVIFNGGLSAEKPNTRPSVTVMHGKSITVLEMDYNVVDFIAISQTPWKCDFQDPVVLAILLEEELVVVDLTTPGYPCVEFPHPIDIHDSPVTCLQYVLDSNSDLTPGLYQVAATKPKRPTSKTEWPMDGGEWSVDSCTGFPELLLTGHADGTVRFWDASAVSLKALYKLRTYKFFKKAAANQSNHKTETADNTSREPRPAQDEDPFAISHIQVCPESRHLAVSNVSSTVICCELNKKESSNELNFIEIHPNNDTPDSEDSPSTENAPSPAGNELKPLLRQESDSLFGSNNSSHKLLSKSFSDDVRNVSAQSQSTGQLPNLCTTHTPLLRLRTGSVKQSCGFQATLFCQFTGSESDPPATVTELSYNSSYGLIVIGNITSLCVIDCMKNTILLNMTTSDVLCSLDHKKQPRSPIRMKPPVSLGDIVQLCSDPGLIKSPSSEPPNGNHTGHPSGSRTPHKENSVSSTSSFNMSAPPRPKKPPHRGMTKKVGSFSFDKSLDSQLSCDDGQFSHASSISDLDRSETKDIVSCLTFANTYAKKGDQYTCPCLWVGTTGGSVFNVLLNMPLSAEQRVLQPVMVSPSGTLLQMKGAVIHCSFLDSLGRPITPPSANWRERQKMAQQNSTEGGSIRSMSPDIGRDHGHVVERQFIIIASEKQIKVFSLPTQSQISVHNAQNDQSYFVCAQVATVQTCACILCYSFNGNIAVFSLPSLSPLLDLTYLPTNDIRISQTICFTKDAQALYMPSSSEIQRLACSVELYENMQEIIGRLFIPTEAPERPNPGFFKGLFGGGVSLLDREELFGENSGKASRAVAKYIPGSGGASLEGLRGRAQHGLTEMEKLRMQALERGEKLGELEEKTQRMHESARRFAENANSIAQKYMNKKWYQL